MLLEPIRVLTNDDMEQIHQTALQILAEIGMKIDSEEALDYLEAAGCRVDRSSFIVKFPKNIVQRFVDKMREDYQNPDRSPSRMAVRYSHVRFKSEQHRIHSDFSASSGGFCCFVYDLDGNKRPAMLDDVRRSISLINHLDNITYSGLPVSDQQSEILTRPVQMAAEIAKYTNKFGGIETFRKEDIPYLIELGTIIKGSLEDLKKEPILVGYGEIRSPLCFDRNMAEIFMEYIKREFPQTIDTMPNGGATAPMTAAGNLALGVAETLAPIVLAYAIDENAVVGVDIIPSNCDMKSGLFRYATADRIPLLIARIQLISEYYGCPSGVHGGKTDSCHINLQTGVDKAMTTVYPILAGAVGIGTVGHLENALTFSPQQAVIDNEIVRYVRRTLQPLQVNPETLALDVIKEVGIGGNYLEHEHTAEHFRDELFLSDLFEVMPWNAAHSQEIKGLENKAYAVAREIWSRTPEPVVSDDQMKAIDSVVASAAKNFLK